MVDQLSQAIQPVNVPPATEGPTRKTLEDGMGFSNTLKEAIAQVNNDQVISDTKTEMLAEGKDIDLHDVMMTAQKASITLETSVQVQKKAIDAYNEIMRMQI